MRRPQDQHQTTPAGKEQSSLGCSRMVVLLLVPAVLHAVQKKANQDQVRLKYWLPLVLPAEESWEAFPDPEFAGRK